MNIYADDDFLSVVDELQPLTLLRRGGDSLELPGARLVRHQITAAPETAGGLLIDEAVWDAPWPPEERLPTLGDKLRNASGCCGIVVGYESLGPGQRLRCRARKTSIGQADSVLARIDQAVWDDLGSGPEVVGWQTWLPAVKAHIRPVSTTVDSGSSSPTAEKEFDITLQFEEELDENHRVIGPDGVVYRVDRFRYPDEFEGLPVVEATAIAGLS